MKKYFYTFALFLSVSFLSYASVFTDSTMLVNNTSHKILYSIPDNYDANIAYPLIIGIHYCGGTAAEYRESLESLTDSLGVIIACPDYSSVQVPNSDTNMFRILVDTTQSIYNINTGEIFLTGMSCNGDFSLSQGLKKVYPFKGIFPWAPWVSTASPEKYNFKSEMPVVISLGTLDDKLNTTLQIYDSLKQNKANVNLILVPGVPHTLDFKEFSSVMVRSLDYLNNMSGMVFSTIDDIMMMGNETKEINFSIENTSDKEYTLKAYSSHPNRIPAPEVVETGTKDNFKLLLEPKNTAGDIHFIIELIEKEGNAICQTTFKVSLEKAVNIENSNSLAQIKIYPNPVNNQLFIENIEKNSAIEVFDVLGNIIYTTTSKLNSINIPFNLPNGLYLIKISNGDRVETHRIVKGN